MPSSTTSNSAPLASVFLESNNYVFYFSDSDTISYLCGSDGDDTYSDTTVVLDSASVKVTVKKAHLAATTYQEKDGTPTSVSRHRIYVQHRSLINSNVIDPCILHRHIQLNQRIGWGVFGRKKREAQVDRRRVDRLQI